MQFTGEEQIRRRLNWFIEAGELGSVSETVHMSSAKGRSFAEVSYLYFWIFSELVDDFEV
ncbi:MAG: hypothetical protein JRG97_08540 [Deltaproteobacteria bacterium]|nr:hypothetical protein [Deltaproteobacteria bacterium]